MSKKILVGVMGVLCLATACRKQCDTVQETYIHKYGVPISKDDWIRNGRDGSIVELKKDGVTLTRRYEKGVLNGETTYTFPNSSTLHIVEMFQGGELVSRVENYISGIPMKEERFSGEFISELTRWYEDGSPAAYETYENGLVVTGEYKTPLNVVEAQILDGNGIRILRGAEGELLAKETIKDRESVERTSFFPNGYPSSITPFEHGLIHGTRTTFLPGGLPNTVESWVHGFQEGITTVYVNGEKFSELSYVRGQKSGLEKRFRDGGSVAEEVTWDHDVQHGPRTLLSDEGAILSTEWYHEGELVSRPTFERMNVR